MTPEQLKLIVETLTELEEVCDALVDVAVDHLDSEDHRFHRANGHLSKVNSALAYLKESL